MPTMQFTGADVGTIDLNDNVNCQVASPGWIPAVSKRRRSAMGNQSLYEDVVESIPLRVFSDHATPATARQAVMTWLHNMTAALDQAQRWAEEFGVVDPVLFAFAPEDSALAEPVKAVVLGPAENAPNLLAFQGSFNVGLGVYEVFITLEFVRTGAWLGPRTRTVGVSDTSSGNPDPVTLSWAAAAKLPSPVEFTLDYVAGSAFTKAGHKSLILVTNDPSRLVVREGESAEIEVINNSTFEFYGDYYTTTVVSAASAGNVAQTTTGVGLGFLLATPMPARLVAVWAVIKNSGGGSAYALSASCASFAEIDGATFSVGKIVDGTPGQTVPASATNPDLYYCGVVSCPEDIQWIQLNLGKVESASNTIQVDYVIFQAIDSDNDYAFLAADFPYTGSTTGTIELHNDPLTEVRPYLNVDYGRPNRRGDLGVHLTGDDIVVLAAGLNGSGGWTIRSGTEANVRLESCYRRLAYLVPQ